MGRIEAEPERYLRMQDLGNEDHHEILREFPRSEWRNDEARGDAWRVRIPTRSGGGNEMRATKEQRTRSMRSMRSMRSIHAFHAFQETCINKIAEEFRRENDIAPDWR